MIINEVCRKSIANAISAAIKRMREQREELIEKSKNKEQETSEVETESEEN